MRLTIQPGIDATQLAQAIYQAIVAGAECDAKARRLKHEAREKLIKTVAVTDTAEQGRLF